MKGLIPAAGLGTRLRPLTYTRPKPVLNVVNKPIIAYAIENLRAAGVHEIGLVVSDRTRLDIETTLGSMPDIKLEYILQNEQLGIAHAIQVAQPWLGESDFCVYLGDNLFGNGVQAFVNDFKREAADAVVALVRVPDPREFGVAVLNDHNHISRLIEKPKDPPSDLAVAGFYCFSKMIHRIIDQLSPSARGEYEITDAIQGLIDTHGTVRGIEVEGWWKDTGRPSDLLEANRLILEDTTRVSGEASLEGSVENSRIIGRVHVEAGAVVRGATILGPTIIGAGALIEEAYVGPYTSIGANAVLRRVEVEFSVIDEAAVLEDVPVRLFESIIGRRTRVHGSNGIPKVHRLILSDTSTLELG